MRSGYRSILVPLIAAWSGAIVTFACVGDEPSTPASNGDGDATTDANTPSTETGPADTGATDDAPVTPDAGPCNTKLPFGTPVVVAGLPVLSAIARFSDDERTAYFSIARDGGGSDIYTATRSSLSEPFGAMSPVAVAATLDLDEGFPAVSRDGLTLVWGAFPVEAGTSSATDLWSATRSTPTGAFTGAMAIPGVNGLTADRYPFLSSDGELWFASTRGGNDDIYRAPFTGNAFAMPVPVPELSSAIEAESYPTLTADKRQIFFTRAITNAGREVWTASRNSTSDPFSTPVPVTELNSSDDERSGWISPDGCRLYLGVGGSGNLTTKVAHRPAN